MQIDNALIQAYISRFVNRTDTWYRQWATKDESGYIHFKPEMKDNRYDYVPVTSRLVQAHIEGKVTCAWPLLEASGCGKYLAFDSDLLDGQLDRLQDAWLDYGWHVLRTKGRADRDGHLFICLDEPIEGKYLIWLADAMMKHARISGLEQFPKRANSSSQLRGPLGVNLKIEANKARDWFIGPKQDITEQLQRLSEQPLNSASVAIELAKEHAPIELPPVLPKRPGKSFKVAVDKVVFQDAVNKTKAKQGPHGWWRGHCLTSAHEHGDRHESLGIKCGEQGQAIVHCFGGCQPRDIYQSIRNF